MYAHFLCLSLNNAMAHIRSVKANITVIISIFKLSNYLKPLPSTSLAGTNLYDPTNAVLMVDLPVALL